ncbi:MAG: ankyrin repeat domain-containing protein [Marinomonas sp.]
MMRKFVWAKLLLAGAAAGSLAGIAAAPIAAQSFSEGYKFLKAVKDREGQEVTDALNEPGTIIVNTRDITTGETALHIVTARRDTSWIRFLTQRGANPNIRDKKGIAPIQVAVRLGHVDGVEELIKAGANVDVSDSSGETPLIAAVHARNTQLIRILLAQGASPDRTDNSGRNARDYAELMQSNGIIMSEFKRADEERKNKNTGPSYGPSF